jgi:predicted metal-dependent hydrolase
MSNKLMTKDAFPWPYLFRQSARAKCYSVHINPREGIEVVIPRGGSKQLAYRFMLSKRHWVERHADRYPILSSGPNPPRDELPLEIELTALDRWYSCHYEQQSIKPNLEVSHNQYELIWRGEKNTLSLFKAPLKQWLRAQAQFSLSPVFHRLSDQVGLDYSKLTWRWQKTLWGSCSESKAISLNAKLLFLPPLLVRYVMIHELCHTRYLSHCPRFWRLVAQFDLDYKKHDNRLRRGCWQRPLWVDCL